MSTGRWQAWILLLSLIAFLAAGCGKGEPGPTVEPVKQVPAENGENHTGEEPSHTALKQPQQVSGPTTGGRSAQSGSNNDEEFDADISDGKSPDRDRATQDGEKGLEISASDDPRQTTAEPSDSADDSPSQPDGARHRLYGISIGDSQAAVTNKFGEPTSSFVMEDGKDSLTVYRYDAFTVGFNSRREVKFIEVEAELPDPGLGGIRLGSGTSDVIRLLGEPDINTEYVLSYASEGAVLKMDVDPWLQIITAIRLFSEE